MSEIEQLKAELRDAVVRTDFGEAVAEGLLGSLPDGVPQTESDAPVRSRDLAVLLFGLAFVSARVALGLRGELSRDHLIQTSELHVDQVSRMLPELLVSDLRYSPSQVDEASEFIRCRARQYQEHFEEILQMGS